MRGMLLMPLLLLKILAHREKLNKKHEDQHTRHFLQFMTPLSRPVFTSAPWTHLSLSPSANYSHSRQKSDHKSGITLLPSAFQTRTIPHQKHSTTTRTIAIRTKKTTTISHSKVSPSHILVAYHHHRTPSSFPTHSKCI